MGWKKQRKNVHRKKVGGGWAVGEEALIAQIDNLLNFGKYSTRGKDIEIEKVKSIASDTCTFFLFFFSILSLSFTLYVPPPDTVVCIYRDCFFFLFVVRDWERWPLNLCTKRILSFNSAPTTFMRSV